MYKNYFYGIKHISITQGITYVLYKHLLFPNVMATNGNVLKL